MLTKKPAQKKPTSEPLNLQAPVSPKGIDGSGSQANSQKKTRIIAQFDVGFGNALYIRGKGANLSWDKGFPMQNTKSNEWIWESDAQFQTGEFKILINDTIFETGQNHALYCGTTIKHTPRF